MIKISFDKGNTTALQGIKMIHEGELVEIAQAERAGVHGDNVVRLHAISLVRQGKMQKNGRAPVWVSFDIDVDVLESTINKKRSSLDQFI